MDAEGNINVQKKKKETFKEFITKNRDVPTKAVFIAFSLTFAGVILFIIGCIKGLLSWDSRIVLIYCLGGLLFGVPGIYFSCKVLRAYKTEDHIARRTILNEIPDM